MGVHTYEITDELAVGLSSSSYYFSTRGVGDSICDVLRDSAREEHWLLTDIANLSPQLLRVQSGDILAIDSDGSRIGDVEA